MDRSVLNRVSSAEEEPTGVAGLNLALLSCVCNAHTLPTTSMVITCRRRRSLISTGTLQSATLVLLPSHVYWTCEVTARLYPCFLCFRLITSSTVLEAGSAANENVLAFVRT